MRPVLDSSLVGEAAATPQPAAPAPVLVLGVGNVLMGDEGVGVHLIRQLEQESLAESADVPVRSSKDADGDVRAPRVRTQSPQSGVRLLDGGTGGVNLLGEFDGVRAILLVDATRDGRTAGSITYLRPERVGDLPRGLGAHDFGLKDLFAASALLGALPELHLYTVSIDRIEPMCTRLSDPVAAAVRPLADMVRHHAARLAAAVG